MLTATVTDYNEFAFSVLGSPEWRTVDIPFSSLEQSPFFGTQVDFSAAGVRGVGIHVAGVPNTEVPPILIESIGFTGSDPNVWITRNAMASVLFSPGLRRFTGG